MTSLTRWEPFRELSLVRNMMDRMFEEPFFNYPRMWARDGQEFGIDLDIAEDENEYTITASIPGIDPADVDITLTDNVLTIKGETKTEHETEKKNYHLRERRYGSFARSVRLPMTVDADKVEATHEHGVLTLHLPKTETAKAKRITVKQTVNGS